MMMQHPIPPFYDKESTILILESFPSVKSQEQMFFYGHPQNRFWNVTAAVYGQDTPQKYRDQRISPADRESRAVVYMMR